MSQEQEQELELMTSELRSEDDNLPTVRMEDIRPSMTEADRDRALAEIVRVLRGEE